MPYIKAGQENSGSIELYYEDHGSGRPVLLPGSQTARRPPGGVPVPWPAESLAIRSEHQAARADVGAYSTQTDSRAREDRRDRPVPTAAPGFWLVRRQHGADDREGRPRRHDMANQAHSDVGAAAADRRPRRVR
jgi:hypothetical protein